MMLPLNAFLAELTAARLITALCVILLGSPLSADAAETTVPDPEGSGLTQNSTGAGTQDGFWKSALAVGANGALAAVLNMAVELLEDEEDRDFGDAARNGFIFGATIEVGARMKKLFDPESDFAAIPGPIVTP
jgi:hypothetical protein